MHAGRTMRTSTTMRNEVFGVFVCVNASNEYDEALCWLRLRSSGVDDGFGWWRWWWQPLYASHAIRMVCAFMFKSSCTILISFVDFCANSFHVLTQTSCRLLLLLFGWCLCWCALVGHRGSQTHTYHNTIKLINSAIYSETDEHGEYSSCFDRQPIMPNICERMWTMNVEYECVSVRSFVWLRWHAHLVRTRQSHTHAQ